MRAVGLVFTIGCLGTLACSGSAKTASGPKLGAGEPDAASASVDAGAASAPALPTLTAENCEALLEKMFALVYAQQTKDLSEAERPTPEDKALAKDRLRAELLSSCEGASPEAFAFKCVIASATFADLSNCRGPAPSP